MHKAYELSFEWDPAKAWSNYKKHSISFERAASIFNDPKAITIFDDEHSDNEDRWITVGLDKNVIIVVVSHTYHQKDERSANIRIISARKASVKEAKQYREA